MLRKMIDGMITTESKSYQVILHVILALVFAPFSLALTRSDVRASSLIGVQENYALFGHVIASHVAKGITVCSQICLSNADCLSFNFRQNSDVDFDGLCQLNNQRCQKAREVKPSQAQGYIYGEFIDVEIKQYIFTPLGAKGVDGPTVSQLVGYKGTNLEGLVNILNGKQLWKVPFTGTYTIEAYGASGGNGTCQGCVGWKLGGLGARIKGTFFFTKETTLVIVVGQRGLPVLAFEQRPGGGGGGTFVTYDDNTKIIIAGGGGGGGLAKPGFEDGDPGQATENGTRHGGFNGIGGMRYNPLNKTFHSADIKASSGAGYKGDGDNLNVGGQPAISFLSGATGGYHAAANGGFGGGGFGMTHGGGGGGYSGGGVIGTRTSGTAGGGGSFNSGSFQINEAGVNEGDGMVIITLIN